MEYIKQKVTTVDGHQYIKTYIKQKQIGKGSFSTCWRVRTQNSNNIYALKIIVDKNLQSLEKQKLVQEIRIHQALTHPHIVHLDHSFQQDGSKYIFLQYCQKGNLEMMAPRFQSMDQQNIKHYSSQIIKALKYLHSKKILHRDLKLPNFFIDRSNDIKLGDFGFACKLQYNQQLRRQTCGTPNYIAPEVVSGYGYSFPSDVWSFGCILFRLKYGYCPFQSQTLSQTLVLIKTANYKFSKKIEISNSLMDLIKRILVINYDERLTLDQIQKHEFYTTNLNIKKSTSISSIKNMITRFFSPSIGRQKKKLEKVDSCENFRDIKKILKQNTQKTEKSQQIQTESENKQRDQKMKQYYANLNVTKRLINQESSKNLYRYSQSKIQTSRLGQMKNKNIKYITQFYSSALIYEFHIQNEYIVCYLTNGIRQIIHKNQIYLIDKQKNIYDKLGNLISNFPKTIQYIVGNTLKQNKFLLTNKNLGSIILNKQYVSNCKNIKGYQILSIKDAHFMNTDLSDVFFFNYQYVSYLYNNRLEVVVNQKQIAKYKTLINQSISPVIRPTRKILQ